MSTFADIDEVIHRFDAQDYLLDLGTASAIYLAVTLGRPLLLEGEPGVGKTTAAKTLAAVLGTPLVRLQCYEGLTAAEALYDWNYQRQLLSIRLAETQGRGYRGIRPVHRGVPGRPAHPAVRPLPRTRRPGPADRRDRPCRRRIRGAAAGVPRRGRGDRAGTGHLRRGAAAGRGAHLQPQPRSARRAAAALPVPLDRLSGSVAGGRDRAPHGAGRDDRADRARHPVRRLHKSLDLDKPPGVAETIDWVAALVALGVADLVAADTGEALASLGALAKTPDDRARSARRSPNTAPQ